MKIDTVVFDIGNVLAAFDWKSFVDSFGFSPEVNKEIARAVFMSKEWPQVDLGLKTDDELIEGFVKNAPHLSSEIRRIFTKWQYSVEEYPFSAGWVRSLKEAGYRVYVLSNYGRTMFGYAKEHFEFFKYIDGGIISYSVNKIKPDPDIYRLLAEKYDIDPKKAVFLDDLQANIDAAAALGFNTVLVTNHETAVDGLKKLGINA